MIETPLDAPPKAAVMVAVWSDATAPALAEKVPDVMPAAMVMEAGTLTALLLLESGTTTEVGAALVRATAQVLNAPGPRLAGVHVNEERAGGATSEMDADLALPPKDAVIVAVWSDVTAAAVGENIAEEVPAATVTEPGTVRAVLLVETETALPPAGAAVVSVTVHAEAPGVFTVAGLQVTEFSTGWGS